MLSGFSKISSSRTIPCAVKKPETTGAQRKHKNMCFLYCKRVSVKTSVRKVDLFGSANGCSLRGISKFTNLRKKINTVLRQDPPFHCRSCLLWQLRKICYTRHLHKRWDSAYWYKFMMHRKQVYGGEIVLQVLCMRVLQRVIDILLRESVWERGTRKGVERKSKKKNRKKGG